VIVTITTFDKLESCHVEYYAIAFLGPWFCDVSWCFLEIHFEFHAIKFYFGILIIVFIFW